MSILGIGKPTVQQLAARLVELRNADGDEMSSTMGRSRVVIRNKTDLNLLMADGRASKAKFPDAQERSSGKWYAFSPDSGISPDKFYNYHSTEGVLESAYISTIKPEFQVDAEEVIRLARAENAPHI